MKEAHVYQQRDQLMIHPMSTLDGSPVSYADDPFVALDDSTAVEDLGRAVLDAIKYSRTVGGPPSRDEMQARERRQWAGFGARSRRQFADGTKLVLVSQPNDDALTVEPTRFEGPPMGWRELDQPLTADARDASAVGLAVRQALIVSE